MYAPYITVQGSKPQFGEASVYVRYLYMGGTWMGIGPDCRPPIALEYAERATHDRLGIGLRVGIMLRLYTGR